MILFISESNELIQRLDFWDITPAEYLVDSFADTYDKGVYSFTPNVMYFWKTYNKFFLCLKYLSVQRFHIQNWQKNLLLVFPKSICPSLKPSVELTLPESHKLRVEEGGSYGIYYWKEG